VYTSEFIKDEKLVRTFFHHVTQEVEDLHKQGISNIQLTLDNLILEDGYHLRILRKGPSLDHKSSNSFAPEFLTQYSVEDEKADMFSLGVLLFIFKTGFPPYKEDQGQMYNLKEMLMEDPDTFWIMYGNLNMNLHHFSEDLKKLINSMVKKDLQKRITLEDLKKSKWFNDEIYSKLDLIDILNKILCKEI